MRRISPRFVPGATYDVSGTGGGSLDAFTAGAALPLPLSFNVSQPNLTDPLGTIVGRDSPQWSWNGGSPATYFQLTFYGVSDAGTLTGDQLFCNLTDDGSFLIPAADMGKFSASSTRVTVLATRRLDSVFPLPVNGSDGVTFGQISVWSLLRL